MSILNNIDTCYNNPKKSLTSKINLLIACGYSLFTHCSFGATKIKTDYYRGKDGMKIICKDLKEKAKK